MRTLEKGLARHHTKCCTIQMCKADGTKAVTDKENAQVFCEHFSKLFDNQTPLPCDHSAIDLIKQHDDYTHLAAPPLCRKFVLPSAAWQTAKLPVPPASPLMLSSP
eukprot:8683063-Ditylum_brightwellii.AAC.1